MMADKDRRQERVKEIGVVDTYMILIFSYYQKNSNFHFRILLAAKFQHNGILLPLMRKVFCQR